MCRSQSLGDSGCPCMAVLTGMTWPCGIGSQFLDARHSRNALSGRMKKPCFGSGASAKALETSEPYIKRFSTADSA